MCYVAPGKTGACDRYANLDGVIIRTDPLTLLDNRIAEGGQIKPFLKADWDNKPFNSDDFQVTA